MNPADWLVWVGPVLGLGAVTAHLLWWVPRLPGPRAWALTLVLAALASGLAFALGSGWLLPAVAVLWGQAGHWRAHRAPREPEAAARGAPAVSAPAPQAAATGTEAQATLGRYRIDGEIGRGSMGAVYLAHDPQIGRSVAVKTLSLTREFQGDKLAEARARFFREAETAGRLQHPDIVTVFDAGETRELAFIAMEYVKGQNLQDFTASGRLLPVPAVLEVVARVADALAYAHAQGVVHRDIKPANVMVDFDSGAVKVMDFGIARLGDVSSTRTGIVLGTPSFMSPEQMTGRPADGRSDLYALGVTLFQLLTGELPHQAEPMARLLQQIVNEPAPDVRSRRPELPEPLASVVALALEKRAELRYADGRQFAADLRAVAAAMKAAKGGAAPPLNEPDEDRPFEKTVAFSRTEPRHNSGP